MAGPPGDFEYEHVWDLGPNMERRARRRQGEPDVIVGARVGRIGAIVVVTALIALALVALAAAVL